MKKGQLYKLSNGKPFYIFGDGEDIVENYQQFKNKYRLLLK